MSNSDFHTVALVFNPPSACRDLRAGGMAPQVHDSHPSKALCSTPGSGELWVIQLGKGRSRAAGEEQKLPAPTAGESPRGWCRCNAAAEGSGRLAF